MEESDEEEGEVAQKVPMILSNSQVKSFMAQILTGLAEMHAKGVWHRDVTPGNLLVTEDGTIKFIDFGISKLAELDKQ